jgi:hypothetical protein
MVFLCTPGLDSRFAILVVYRAFVMFLIYFFYFKAILVICTFRSFPDCVIFRTSCHSKVLGISNTYIMSIYTICIYITCIHILCIYCIFIYIIYIYITCIYILNSFIMGLYTICTYSTRRKRLQPLFYR